MNIFSGMGRPVHVNTNVTVSTPPEQNKKYYMIHNPWGIGLRMAYAIGVTTKSKISRSYIFFNDRFVAK